MFLFDFYTVGMLWTGVAPEVKALEENMASYFNILQGFLLLSHGSTVGAGPTLSSYVNTSMKQVIDSSFVLWKESVSSYGILFYLLMHTTHKMYFVSYVLLLKARTFICRVNRLVDIYMTGKKTY